MMLEVFHIVLILLESQVSLIASDITSDGCNPLVYRVLDDHRRSVNYRPSSSVPGETNYASAMASSANRYDVVDSDLYDEDEAIDISFAHQKEELLCDDVLPQGWYRFLSYGMSRDMATSCPGPGSCGTVAPVWLDMTSHKNLTGQTFSVDACVSWGFGDGGFDNFDCCLFTLPVQVKQCSGFKVYHLGPTQACDIAYCSAKPSISNQWSLKPLAPITPKPQILTPPVIKMEWKNGRTCLKCHHECPSCKVTWHEMHPRGGQKYPLSYATTEYLYTFTPTNHHLVVCEIQSSTSQTSLESQPYPLGFEFSRQLISLIRNSETYQLEIKQHLPLHCPDESCQMKISLVAQDLDFIPCSPILVENAQDCHNSGQNTSYCNLFTVSIRAKPNYQSNFHQVKGTIKLTFEMVGKDILMQHDFLDYSVENRPTSQCHLWTYGHIVTFDQFLKQIKVGGDTILLQNEDFRATANMKACLHNQRCFCGLTILDGNSRLSIQSCNDKRELTIDGTISDIYSARNGSLIYASFPSGRFIRLDLISNQMSLTLQSIGADFKNAKGICGNMDTIKANDKEDNYFDEPIVKGSKMRCDESTKPRFLIPVVQVHKTPIIPPQSIQKVLNFNTAFESCTETLINSSIATTCGPYFDRDITNAVDICIHDTNVSGDYASAERILPLIEAQCEASLVRNAINPTEDILKAFYCPENCSNRGVCQDFLGCQCNVGYTGFSCQFQEDYETLEIIEEVCDDKSCSLNGTCHAEKSIHPANQCLHCVDGSWLEKSDGYISLATSELNKKFKVINGDMFEYTLPRIDSKANITQFELLSGPYGATVSTNGTLKWLAISNLIADSWTELLIIKAKGVCGEYTLIEVTVHVVTCGCMNEATCVLVHDIPKCHCKKGFKGDKCEFMEDPCMVPRCNFGKCIAEGGINFKCICDPGYTGSLCSTALDCQHCHPGVECLDSETCGPCPDGYTGNGKTCTKTKPCELDPCFLGVECFAIGDDDFVCGHCPPGLTGNGKKCYETTNEYIEHLCDDVETNPCFDQSMCQVEHGQVYCKACPPGHRGDGITCYPVKDNPCDKTSSNPCYAGSKCQVVNGIITCGPCPSNMTGDGKLCYPCQEGEPCSSTCPSGFIWQHNQCMPEQCNPNPCYPGVQCEMQDGLPVCGSCPKGMIGDGETCSRQVLNHCISDPCYPGVECYSLEDTFQCGACPEGLTGNGLTCDPATDPCHPSPCYQGVPCVTIWEGRQSMFACGLCPDGMVGDGMECSLTETKENQTYVVPCPDANHCHPLVDCLLNNETIPYIACGHCPDGYLGNGIKCRPKCTSCDRTKEVCFEPEKCTTKCDPPCQNEGKCTRNGKCKCKNGYKGSTCGKLSRKDKMLSSCLNKPCLNGGICVDGKCTCPPGFKGRRCQKSLSEPNLGYLMPSRTGKLKCKRKCLNGGICSRVFGNRCKCPPGYRGRYCQKPKCKGGCRNGGTCIAPDTCQCQSGFEGINCQRRICNPPCENGGRCRKSGKCKCPYGTRGKQCQVLRKLRKKS